MGDRERGCLLNIFSTAIQFNVEQIKCNCNNIIEKGFTELNGEMIGISNGQSSPTGELMFLNEATLLDNLKTRYFKDKIYVSQPIDQFFSAIYL